MSQLPKFLVIGVQKAATSWLFYCLQEHPEIFLPSHKREVDYLGGEKYQQRGWEWWASRFEGAKSRHIVGDVSVDYIYSTRSAKLIKENLGDVKFVISLRDPIDRAISAYYWNLRKGKIPNKPLNKGMEAILKTLIKKGGSDFDSKTERVYRNIIMRGFYDEQISRYLDYFELKNFLFLDFDNIKRNPLRQVQSIYDFLGVNKSYNPTALNRKPKNNAYLDPLIVLERRAGKSRLTGKLADWLNGVASKLGIGNSRPKLEKELKNKLLDIYTSHNEKLLDILLDYQNTNENTLTEQNNWRETITSWNKIVEDRDKKTGT